MAEKPSHNTRFYLGVGLVIVLVALSAILFLVFNENNDGDSDSVSVSDEEVAVDATDGAKEKSGITLQNIDTAQFNPIDADSDTALGENIVETQATSCPIAHTNTFDTVLGSDYLKISGGVEDGQLFTTNEGGIAYTNSIIGSMNISVDFLKPTSEVALQPGDFMSDTLIITGTLNSNDITYLLDWEVRKDLDGNTISRVSVLKKAPSTGAYNILSSEPVENNVGVITFRFKKQLTDIEIFVTEDGGSETLFVLDSVPANREFEPLGIVFGGAMVSPYAGTDTTTFRSHYDNFKISCVEKTTDTEGGALSVVYRFFNTETGAHIYTNATNERDDILNNLPQFTYEGEKYKVFKTEQPGTVPVYRFFNTSNGTHIYTTARNEKEDIENNLPQFVYEGVKYYVYEDKVEGTNVVHRFFNTTNGAHIYTDATNEKNDIQNNLPQFTYEGEKFYVFPL